MGKSSFTENQIITILKEVEKGRTVKDVCRQYSISDATYYQWKSKYGGMQASDIRKLRELEDENRRLKQMYADLSLENRALKDVIAKKLRSRKPNERWFRCCGKNTTSVSVGPAKPPGCRARSIAINLIIAATK